MAFKCALAIPEKATYYALNYAGYARNIPTILLEFASLYSKQSTSELALRVKSSYNVITLLMIVFSLTLVANV